jgi:hypothetical protein
LRAAIADAISGLGQRSWWAVEPVGRHAYAPVIDAGGKPPTHDVRRIDRNHGGEHARKISMQSAASISQVAVVVAVIVVVGRALAMIMRLVGGVLVMGMGGDRISNGLIGTRRGHDTRELGHHEHGDQ